ncbi:retropepsin-like aspartic protease [Nostoc sp. FACHB-888]|uniref:retropepsin-like aspartic protease family protein n=1 Tax=Nostoc sp. FACHB-888 TaxID=2692842 RepID=UPI001683D04E|nr:retropepsin-like aspartic protease [Nostoc sp. FACHB-888]MBD2246404.1 retroviral-like aspartic protease family protein [Nostoc sp. FACHB-888]MCC5649486.1 retroviral-like aspartic protease family protein [Nostoc sp. XA013]
MKNAWRRWITTVNLAAIALMPTLIFLAFSHRATADDPGACYMVTSSGKTVGLGRLCGNNIFAAPSDNRVFRVPVKRRFGGTPVIDVTFNDKKTFEMIVDTGSSGTIITQGMANTLKLQATGTIQAQIADGREVEFPTSKVKSIAAGGVTANNLQVAIAPKASIGLLGHDFFGKYDIKILEKEVEFYHR